MPPRRRGTGCGCGSSPGTAGSSDLDVELLLVALAPDLDTRFERLYGYLNDDVTRRRATIGLALRAVGRPAGRRARPGPGRARTRRCVRPGCWSIEDADRPFLTAALRVPDRVAAPPARRRRRRPGATPACSPKPSPLVRRPRRRLARALRRGVRLVLCARARPAGRRRRSPSPHWPGTVAGARASTCPARHRAPTAGAIARSWCARRCCAGGVVAGPVEALADAAPGAVRRLADAPVPVRARTGPARGTRSGATAVPLLDAEAGPPNAGAARAPRGASVSGPTGRRRPRHRSATAHFVLAPAAGRAGGPGGPSAALRRGGRRRRDICARRARAERGRARTPGPADRAGGRLGRPRAARPRSRQLHELAARARHRERVLDEWRMRPGGGRGTRRHRPVRRRFGHRQDDVGRGRSPASSASTSTRSTWPRSSTSTSARRRRTSSASSPRPSGVNARAALRRGRRHLRQAQRGPRRPRPVRQHRERLPAAAHGDLRRARHARDEPARQHRRRLHPPPRRVVDFPEPDEALRRGLWGRCLAPALPRADDLDLEFCAAAFELSGGNIRSVAITAAYRAAAADEPIGDGRRHRAPCSRSTASSAGWWWNRSSGPTSPLPDRAPRLPPRRLARRLRPEEPLVRLVGSLVVTLECP